MLRENSQYRASQIGSLSDTRIRSPLSQRERFAILCKIGEGTYGIVYKCEDLVTGQPVAMKKIRLDGDDEGVPSWTLREVSLLREIVHQNVVRLIDVVCHDRKLNLILEYMEHDLKHLLDLRKSPLIGRGLKRVVFQLLSGLNACHSRRIVHRDVKPQNVLVSQDGRVVKLADFGMCRAFRVPTTTYTHDVITLWYRAPEILLGERHYLPAVDLWSVGCVMAELATKQPLFPGECEIHQLYQIFQLLGTPTDEVWEGVTQLPEFSTLFPRWPRGNLAQAVSTLDVEGLEVLGLLLTYSPRERPSAHVVMQHRWFDEVRLDPFGVGNV